MKTKLIILLLFAALLIGTAVLQTQMPLKERQSCGNSTLSSTMIRSNLKEIHFGGVRKYALPAGRSPNAILVAVDGSVWFGEQTLPGLGHLFLNGTLIEYKWPFQYPAPTYSTFIWGIAAWNGCVWASDDAASQLVAVNPDTGFMQTIKLDPGSFPYTLTVGPDDSLWFTEVFASKIGRLDGQLQLHEYPTAVGGTPAEIAFANDSSGYYVETGNVGIVEPAVYSFNTRDFSPARIDSGAVTLRAPTSLALTKEGVWVTQHAASNLAYYDFNRRDWTLFPTSPVSYQKTTLPYFVAANGSMIWFNEHYANRLAKLDVADGLLTEYSLSDPPASKIVGIDNALTFALGKDKVWFTELTANYVGYVDAAYRPNFKISHPTNSNLELKTGGKINLTFTVTGESETPLSVLFADSEGYTGRPAKIIMNASITQFQSLNGKEEFKVTVTAENTTTAGAYTLLIAVTDGLIVQGSYLRLCHP